ncbi:MAG: adenylate/guanylate cyclase domain-containing protein [Leptonema sp. (in: bacteria)]
MDFTQISFTLSITFFVLSLSFLVFSFFKKHKRILLLFFALTFILSVTNFLKISWFGIERDNLRRWEHLVYFLALPLFVYTFSLENLLKIPNFLRKFSIFLSSSFIILLFLPNLLYIEFRFVYHIAIIFYSFYFAFLSYEEFLLKKNVPKIKWISFLFIFSGFTLDILLVLEEKVYPFPYVSLALFIILILAHSYRLLKEREQLLESKKNLVSEIEEIKKKSETYSIEENNFKKINHLYESLLDLTRKVSNISDFDLIIEEIERHLEKNFRIKFFVIMVIPPHKQEAYFFKSNLYKKLSQEQYEFMIKGEGFFNLDLRKKGVHQAVYIHKKPLFLKHFSESSKKSYYDFENQLIDKLNLKSLIIFPLIFDNEVFGFFDITHADEPLKLSNEEYINLNIFIQYFSTIFKNYLLFQDIKEKTQQLEMVNSNLTKQNQIILKINEVLSKINESYEIRSILETVIQFLREFFNIEYVLFYKYEKSKKSLVYQYTNIEDLISKEALYELQSTPIEIENSKGVHALSCQKKRYVYLSKLKKSKDEQENFFMDLLQIRSVLIFPLFSGNELLGTLDFTFFKKSKLNKVSLTLIHIFIKGFASILKNKFLIEELENNQLKLEKSLLKLELAKKDLEKRNEFAKKINALVDFSEIIQDIFDYFNENYELKYGWLILVEDSEKKFLGANFTKLFLDFEPTKVEFLKNFNAPIEESSGTLYRTYQRQKIFYIPKIKYNFIGSDVDQIIIKILNLQWFIQIPLILKNKVIGILSFTNYEKVVHLKQDQLQSIMFFCEQITGALYTTYLLNQIQKEKNNAELAKEELKQLNEFTRQIMEEDFENVIQNIFKYLKKRFYLDFGWLLLIDKEKNRLQTSSFSRDTNLSTEMYEFLKNFDEPITPELGTLYRSIKNKKHLYIKRINPDFSGAEIDKKLVKITNVKWTLYIPLLIQQECIGILAFTSFERESKLNLENIQSISFFCNQISGAIYNSYLKNTITKEKEKSEQLLLNILPKQVAYELKENGFVKPKFFSSATILFTDFVGFTRYASQLSPEQLIKELDLYFTQFDEIILRNHLTKLKTIGDAYMCVGGIPIENKTHAIDACLAALEIQNLILKANEIRKLLNSIYLEVRIGMNTGPIVAGVIGKERFAYDIWGDTVNLAQRLESASQPYRINISLSTYQLVKYFFLCEYRGKYTIKNRGKVDMFFLNRIHPKLSQDKEGKVPNDRFFELYEKLKHGAKFIFKHEVRKKIL